MKMNYYETRKYLMDGIETIIEDLINDYDISDIKGDIQIATNYVIDFDGDNIVWKEKPNCKELRQAYNGIKELWDYKNGQE